MNYNYSPPSRPSDISPVSEAELVRQSTIQNLILFKLRLLLQGFFVRIFRPHFKQNLVVLEGFLSALERLTSDGFFKQATDNFMNGNIEDIGQISSSHVDILKVNFLRLYLEAGFSLGELRLAKFDKELSESRNQSGQNLLFNSEKNIAYLLSENHLVSELLEALTSPVHRVKEGSNDDPLSGGVLVVDSLLQQALTPVSADDVSAWLETLFQKGSFIVSPGEVMTLVMKGRVVACG